VLNLNKAPALLANIRENWKARDEHASLVQKSINYGQKQFYNIGPRLSIMEILVVCVTHKVRSVTPKNDHLTFLLDFKQAWVFTIKLFIQVISL